ncbi:MAG: bifunctional (p)ppGpp synthetase/guanosine-3',5'-bis(diphosphate) 3'-pyrophosphohydrolase [Gammaproteobacteria bacterium]|nr:bifunctional (p)ppGpp synthetase/guanosine-3',5'-bis(diphosphate) 3'-pyrophosphohydrolase [Gammaproteobacteria bacterium]
MAEAYMTPDQVSQIYDAYLFGAEFHEGQHRSSGEPYIYHPLAVASILLEMHMDAPTIVAAVLHDVIEDTQASKALVAERFGEQIAEIVDGVSKLSAVNFPSKVEQQAESLRKMLMAMVKDIRVIIIKLADRLHNMRTLGALVPEKARRIARETLEIYAPIANRLGMHVLRLELEDLGFKAMYPKRYSVLCRAMRSVRGDRSEVLRKIENAINTALEGYDVRARVLCREKHVYSIYQKMRKKHLPLRELQDVYAVRLITDDIDDCYRLLGIVHNLWKPVPGRFKDFIAIPKANGYQSLHSVLVTPHRARVEVQIRTDEMDHIAESGIAAHWLYKTGDGGSGATHNRAREWLRELLEIQGDAGSQEFLDGVKVDLFPDEVYVFTPAGDIIKLPRGATVIDFAYAVHTELGNGCVAAWVNHRAAPLSAELRNGDAVAIQSDKAHHPNPSWLNFVTTAKARSAIRHYLKQLKAGEAVNLGRRLLDIALSRYGIALSDLEEHRKAAALTQTPFRNLDELMADIGLGNRPSELVARRIAESSHADMESLKETREASAHRLSIRGTEGMLVRFAGCCHPIPGDRVIGFMSAGRGLVIHRNDCRNARKSEDPDRWIDVEWAAQPEGEYQVSVRVDVANRRGALASIASAIAAAESNIENVQINERDGQTSSLTFCISVRDRAHLAAIMRAARRVRLVLKISRI